MSSSTDVNILFWHNHTFDADSVAASLQPCYLIGWIDALALDWVGELLKREVGVVGVCICTRDWQLR